jgi:tetratricopeptide (TPR) repeat protein
MNLAGNAIEALIRGTMETGRLTRDQAISAIGFGKPGFNPRRVRERLAVFNESIAHNERGIALRVAGNLHEAIAAHRQALALRPDFAKAHSDIGFTLGDLGRVDESLAAHRKAVACWPDGAAVHFGYGNALLLDGQYVEGFKEYEWRWKGTGDPTFASRGFSQPRWSGEDIEGRTLLLHAEQGIGDTLQFVRFISELPQFNGRVLLEVQPTLVPLLRSVPGIEAVVAAGDPLLAFDVYLPLMSLPHILGTRLDTIPALGPYLWCDPERAAA